MGKGNGKKEITIVSFILGGLLIIGIIKFAGIKDICSILKSLSLKTIIYLIVLDLIVIFLYAYRWFRIIKRTKSKVNFWNIVKIEIIGIFFNAITPGAQAGGEPVRAYLLSKTERINGSKSVATIMVERLYDIIIYSIIMLVSVFALFKLKTELAFKIIILLGLVIGIFITISILYISINPNKSKKIVKKILKILRNLRPMVKKVEIWSLRLDDEIMRYTSSFKKALSKSCAEGLFYTIAMRGSEILRLYMICKIIAGIGIKETLTIYALLVIASLIPSPPAGIGIEETTYILGLKALGVEMAKAASIMILSRFFGTILFTLIGGILTYYEFGIKGISRIKEKAKKAKERAKPRL